MLSIAKKHPFAELICQNLEDDLNTEISFEAVVCVGVTDFIKDVSGLLQKIKLRLAPEGCISMSIPANGDNSFDEVGIKKIMAMNGFKIEKIQRIFGYVDTTTGEDFFYYIVVLIL